MEEFMKKFFGIMALLAVFMLIVIGCQAGTDDNVDSDPVELLFDEVFPDTEFDSAKAIIAFDGSSMTAIPGTEKEMNADLFRAGGGFNASAYKGIKFEYRTTNQANFGLQDSADPNSIWLIINWGAFTEKEWTEVECIFSRDLINGWGESTSFNKSKFEKIWIGINPVNESTIFEVRDMYWIK